MDLDTIAAVLEKAQFPSLFFVRLSARWTEMCRVGSVC